MKGPSFATSGKAFIPRVVLCHSLGKVYLKLAGPRYCQMSSALIQAKRVKCCTFDTWSIMTDYAGATRGHTMRVRKQYSRLVSMSVSNPPVRHWQR